MNGIFGLRHGAAYYPIKKEEFMKQISGYRSNLTLIDIRNMIINNEPDTILFQEKDSSVEEKKKVPEKQKNQNESKKPSNKPSNKPNKNNNESKQNNTAYVTQMGVPISSTSTNNATSTNSVSASGNTISTSANNAQVVKTSITNIIRKINPTLERLVVVDMENKDASTYVKDFFDTLTIKEADELIKDICGILSQLSNSFDNLDETNKNAVSATIIFTGSSNDIFTKDYVERYISEKKYMKHYTDHF